MLVASHERRETLQSPVQKPCFMTVKTTSLRYFCFGPWKQKASRYSHAVAKETVNLKSRALMLTIAWQVINNTEAEGANLNQWWAAAFLCLVSNDKPRGTIELFLCYQVLICMGEQTCSYHGKMQLRTFSRLGNAMAHPDRRPAGSGP